MLDKFKQIKWHLVPVALLFGLLPLIMHLSYFKVDPIYQVALQTDVYPDWFFFYKGLVFTILTVIMLIFLILGRKKYPLCRDLFFKIYAICGLAFIIMTILSTYFSPYRDLAMIGGPTRYEGLGIMICYIMVMFYCYAVFQDTSDYKYIIIPFSFTTIIQAITGFTQMIGRDFTQWKFIRDIIAPGEFESWNFYVPGTEPWFPPTAPSWQGTLGNSNYSGSFISLALPLFLILTCTSKTKRQRLVLGTITLCALFISFGCNSRAGLLCCTLAFILLLLCMLRSFPLLINKLLMHIKKYSLASGITISTCFILIAILCSITNVTSRFNYLLYDINHFLQPSSSSSLPDYSIPETAPLQDIQQSENHIIKLCTSSLDLTIEAINGKIYYRNILGQRLFPFTLHSGNYSCSILYTPPYVGYTFEQIVDEDQIRLRFYIDKDVSDANLGAAICGILVDNKNSAQLVDYRTLNPLIIDTPETFGFEGKETLGSGRGYIWSRSLPLLKKYMLLGAGPDMYILAFPYNDFIGKIQFLGSPIDCVDKPHNTYLQFWINQGFVAFLSFIVMCGTYIIHCLILYGFKKRYTSKELFGLAFMCAIVGYLGASFFNDTTLSVTPLFFALLGAGMAYNVIYRNGTKTLD